jgi:CoA:oxalate CoA-transferase
MSSALEERVAPPQTAAHRPLSGITVIDLSHVYNGPYATLLMALAGARVIKVEPKGGEHQSEG